MGWAEPPQVTPSEAEGPEPGVLLRLQVCEPRNRGAVGKQSPRDCVTWAALS